MAGGSGGGKSSGQRTEGQLSDFLKQFAEESQPLREALFGQTLQALQTGGVGARLPIVQKGVEETKRATSQALTGLDERLASLGLAGSPFGERIRSETAQRGATTAAGIPIQVALQMLGIAPNLVLGSTGQLGQGYGTLAGVGAQKESAERQQIAQIFSGASNAGATFFGA